MKQTFLLLSGTVFFSLLLASCQKDIVDDLPGEPQPSAVRLRTYIEDATNTSIPVIDTFDINYDSQDRILSVTGRLTGLKVLYNYHTSDYITDIKIIDHLIIRDVSYLNSLGWVDSTFQSNDDLDSSATKLIYNSNNQLIEERLYAYTTETGSVPDGNDYYEYDPNGNVIKYTEKRPTGETIATTTYTYNSFQNTVFLTPLYRPIPYKNLPVIKRVVYNGGSTESSETEYTYDSNNNVISEKETGSDGTFIIKKYIYQ
jgi:hypothetical protein